MISGNIRKQLGPVKKRLNDRIKEANETSHDLDLRRLTDLRNKLFANIESHEKVYFKLDALEDLSAVEQDVIDEEWESSTDLNLDANEVLGSLNHRIIEMMKESETSLSKTSKKEDEKIDREIEKLIVDTEYKRKKMEKLQDKSDEITTQNIKLPTLELPMFAGKITDRPTFWDSFKSTVHQNEKMSKIDKFKYLLSLLRDEAKDTVRGFNLTENYYEQAIEQLKERYDDEEQIIPNHYMLLSNAPRCRNVTQDLRLTFNFLEAQIRSLEALGENIENNYIISLMKSKFPTEFNQKLEETHEGVWTRKSLQKIIGRLIVAREKSENDVTKYERPDESEYTAEGLLSRENKIKCYFCGRNHWSDECQQFKILEERKSKIRGRCFICLSNKHLYCECLSEKPCFYCKRKRNHHSSLCPTKFGPNSSNDGGEEELIEVGEETDVNMKHDVMMKTARVELWNVEAGRHKVVIALLDTGAKRTCITKEVADSLRLEHGPTKLVKMNTFGTTDASSMCTNRTNFAVKLKDSSKFIMNASICENITGSITKHKLDMSKYRHVWKDLLMADDVPSRTTVVKIDLLIGNDYYEDVVKTEKIKIDDGLYLVNYTLGWLFSGRIITNDIKDN